MVGRQGGRAGATSSLWPGHTSPGGRGVLSKQGSVLKEGLRAAAARYGLGTPL